LTTGCSQPILRNSHFEGDVAVRILASGPVRRYLAAQLLSLFGDSAMYLALGIWVKSLTGSSAAAGLVFFVFLLPTLLAPAAGMLVDRVSRRRLLIGTNLATALVLLPLLLVHSKADVWLVYLVTFGYGVSSPIVASAQSALLTVLVPADDLGDVNGLLQTGKEGLRLLAPLVGAGLYALWGSAVPVMVVDVATFLVAAGLLATVHIAEPTPEPSTGSWRADLMAGLRHVRRTSALAQLVGATAVCTAVFGFFETLVYSLADALGQPPTFVGILTVAQGIGAVAGGVTAARLLRRFGDVRLAGAGLATVAGGVAVLLVGAFGSVLLGAVVFGLGVPWLVVALITALQRRTPIGLQGRVMAVADLSLNVPMTVSIAVGAALAAALDWRVLVAVMAAVTGGAAVFLLTRPGSAQPGVDVPGPLGDRPPAELLDRPAPAGFAHPSRETGVVEERFDPLGERPDERLGVDRDAVGVVGVGLDRGQ
jgi:MFS family permease